MYSLSPSLAVVSVFSSPRRIVCAVYVTYIHDSSDSSHIHILYSNNDLPYDIRRLPGVALDVAVEHSKQKS